MHTDCPHSASQERKDTDMVCTVPVLPEWVGRQTWLITEPLVFGIGVWFGPQASQGLLPLLVLGLTAV